MYSAEKPVKTPIFTGFSTEYSFLIFIENLRKFFNLFVQADEHADSFWSDSKNVIIFFLGCEKKLFQQWSSLQCIQIYGSIVLKGIMLCNSALTKRLLL